MKIFLSTITLLLSIIGLIYLYNRIEEKQSDLDMRISRLERIEEYKMMQALNELLQNPNNNLMPSPSNKNKGDRGT